MGSAIAETRLRRLPLIVTACAVAGASLAGCASISEKFANTASDAPVIGLPAGTPERPVTQAAYPAVHNMPPARPAMLSNHDQIQIESELTAARNKQQVMVGQPPSPPPAPQPAVQNPFKKPAAQATPAPAAPAAAPSASSSSIY